jgi:hypothetical protein
MITCIRKIKTLLFLLLALLSSHIYAVGLYDASYENNLLKIPLIKVGDVVYEVTMIREDSAALARIGCVDFCFRLASAEVARNYSSSIYAFYDASTSTATIDNLWFENRVYKVTLKHAGQMNGSDYFSLVNADQKQGLPVYLTSYENKNNLNISPQRYPTWDQLDWVGGIYASNVGAGVAFADFFQDGTISMVLFTNRSEYKDGPHRMITGAIQFFKYDINGNPVDRTSELLRDTVGCIAPRKLLVADFNADGRPDIFAACHGPEDIIPFPGEQPKLLLSQPDGTYENITIEELNCYCHTASAADINGDGNIDIITLEDMNQNDQPRLTALINDGDGNFKVEKKYRNIREFIPKIDGGDTASASVFTLELIDINSDGFPDLVLATQDSSMRDNLVLLNRNGLFFDIDYQIRIPMSKFWVIDMVAIGSTLYFYGSPNYIANPTVDFLYIYKFDVSSNFGEFIYNSNGRQWPEANVPIDFVWIMLNNGNIVPVSDAYTSVAVPTQ